MNIKNEKIEEKGWLESLCEGFGLLAAYVMVFVLLWEGILGMAGAKQPTRFPPRVAAIGCDPFSRVQTDVQLGLSPIAREQQEETWWQPSPSWGGGVVCKGKFTKKMMGRA